MGYSLIFFSIYHLYKGKFYSHTIFLKISMKKKIYWEIFQTKKMNQYDFMRGLMGGP